MAAFGMARAAQVKWDVSVGFSGFFRPGEWTPVTVIIDYTNPTAVDSNAVPQDIRGNLEVYTSSINNNKYLSRRAVEIPVSSRLRYSFLIKLSDNDTEVDVILRNERGRQVLKQRITGLNPLKPTESFTVIPSSGGLSIQRPTMIDQTINQEYITKVAAVDPLYLPDHWFGYNGVNLILLENYEDKMLTRLQVDAIDNWVKRGGSLWVFGGANTLNYQDQLIEEIFPVKVKNTHTLNWAEQVLVGNNMQGVNASLSVSGVEVNPDAQVLLTENKALAINSSLPLLVKGKRGNGNVYFWSVDFASPFFAISPVWQTYWWSLYPFEVVNDNLPHFWRRLLPNMESKLGSEKVSRFPSLFLIFIFIMVYAAVIGPLNFYVLSRRKKMEWGWITVPLIIAVFTVTVYGWALIFKGRSFFKRDLELWITKPGSLVIDRQAHSLVFSSRSQNLAIYHNNDVSYTNVFDTWDARKEQIYNGNSFRIGAGLSGGATVSGMTPGTVRNVVETLDRQMFVPRSAIDQWSPANFEGESLEELDSPMIECDLTLVQGEFRNELKGKLANTSDYDLKDVFIQMDNRILELGDLNRDDNIVLDNLSFKTFNSFFDVRNEQLKNRPIDNALYYPEHIWMEMTTILTNWTDYRSFVHPNKGQLVLYGSVDNPGAAPDLSMAPGAMINSRHVVLVCPLYYKVEVPPGTEFRDDTVERALIYINEDTLSELTDRSREMTLSKSSMTLMTELPLQNDSPLPRGARLDFQLQLGKSEIFHLNVYNYRVGSWESMEGKALSNLPGRYQLNLDNRYVSPVNGRVFCRIDSRMRSTAMTYGDGNDVENFLVRYIY